MDRTALLGALAVITAARREAMGDLDTERASLLASTAPTSNEEMAQTLGGLVRQLDNAARELGDAIRTLDQQARIANKP